MYAFTVRNSRFTFFFLSIAIATHSRYLAESSYLTLEIITDSRVPPPHLETGSLISIRKNVKNIVIPSEEYHVKMFPMDFEEFAWATGHEAMLPLIERRFCERLPLDAATYISSPVRRERR